MNMSTVYKSYYNDNIYGIF